MASTTKSLEILTGLLSGNPYSVEITSTPNVSLIDMKYYVYILANRRRTVLYTGMTGDIEGRVFDHKVKSVKGFTSKYNCDRLVHLETFGRALNAIAREKELKKWRRSWKENLINENNPNWEDLSEGWYDPKDLAAGLSKGFRVTPASRRPRSRWLSGDIS